MTGVWDPEGADKRRKENLRGVATQPGKDRDEFPPASIKLDDDSKSSVRLVDSSDNRSSGAALRQEVRQKGVRQGDRVRINLSGVVRVNGRLDSLELKKLDKLEKK
ncbi:hypothetical protein RDG67_002802 [Vibrio cholerae]|nr:hypothetical protein [Vibrio cholerae]